MTKRKPTRLLVTSFDYWRDTLLNIPVKVVLDTTEVIAWIEHNVKSIKGKDDRRQLNAYSRFLKSLDGFIDSYRSTAVEYMLPALLIEEIGKQLGKVEPHNRTSELVPVLEVHTPVLSAGMLASAHYSSIAKRCEPVDAEPVRCKAVFDKEEPYRGFIDDGVVIAQDCVFNEDSEWVDLDLQTGRMPHALWSFALHVYESPDEPFVVTAKEVAELLYSYNVARLWMSTEGNRGVCGAALVQISKGGLHPDIVKMYNRIFKLLTPIEALSKERREELGLSLDAH